MNMIAHHYPSPNRIAFSSEIQDRAFDNLGKFIVSQMVDTNRPIKPLVRSGKK
jgi:hypothetical protein